MAMMGVQTISAQNANDGYDMTMSIKLWYGQTERLQLPMDKG